MAEKSDYYDILGVSKGATDEEIKKAYRKQAIEWHPDKHQEDKEAAEKRFKEINEAYQILSDKQKRAAYDQYGHTAFSPGGAGGFPGGNPFAQGGKTGPFTWTYTNSGGQGSPFSGFDFGDPFDIFEQFFGGGGSPFGRSQRVPRYSISIDFMDAVKGVEKQVDVGGKRRKIKIPAGVNEGQRIRFDDFILSINIRQHELFERDGADIFVKVEIPYWLAVLGGKTEVPTVDGNVGLKIRKGMKSGTMMRLRGKGVPHLQGRGKGDQYVKLNVNVPDRLTKEQKKLVEMMKEEDL